MVEPIRVLCLHGAFLSATLLKMGLAPLIQAARRRQDDRRVDFIFEEGPLVVSTDELRASGYTDPVWEMYHMREVRSWAMNDDRADHGGREYSDLAIALERLQMLLRKHAPIHGVLGMSQGGNLAQPLAAQAAAGQGAQLRFTVHFGGCSPGWQHQLPDLFATPLPLPALIVSGERDNVDGARADPGGRKMAALCQPAAVVRRTHPDGHRPFPADRTLAMALAGEVLEFILDPEGFVRTRAAAPALAASPTPAVAATPVAATAAPALAATPVAAAAAATGAAPTVPTSPAAAAAAAHVGSDDALINLLASASLSHLTDILVATRLEDLGHTFKEQGRVEFLSRMKAMGIVKLSERQGLANAISKHMREQQNG